MRRFIIPGCAIHRCPGRRGTQVQWTVRGAQHAGSITGPGTRRGLRLAISPRLRVQKNELLLRTDSAAVKLVLSSSSSAALKAVLYASEPFRVLVAQSHSPPFLDPRKVRHGKQTKKRGDGRWGGAAAAAAAAANAAASGVCRATGGLGAAGPAPSARSSAFVEPGEVSSADGGASGEWVRAKRPGEVRARPFASAGAKSGGGGAAERPIAAAPPP